MNLVFLGNIYQLTFLSYLYQENPASEIFFLREEQPYGPSWFTKIFLKTWIFRTNYNDLEITKLLKKD